MNIHENARLTLARRIEMVHEMISKGFSACAALSAYGATAPTLRKWLGRYLALGKAGLFDASSRPACSPRAIASAKALTILELRRKRLTQARIATALSVSKITVDRVLALAGLSRLENLQPVEPVVRYEHDAPGKMLHIDTKKLGRTERPAHRVTSNRRDSAAVRPGRCCSWPMMTTHTSRTRQCTSTRRRLRRCNSCATRLTYYACLGVKVEQLLSDDA